MKWMTMFATIVATAIVGVSADAEWEQHGAVHLVEDATWDKFRADNPAFLAMFYAPWCGHCKAMKPALTEASTKMENEYPFAAVDCTQHKPTCAKFDVSGYPTVKYFTSSTGDATDYNGGRDVDSLIAFAKKQVAAMPPKELVVDDIPKMKLKLIKYHLKQRGHACTGCTEKREYVQLLKEVADAPMVTEEELKPKPKKGGKKSTLVNGRTFAQERAWKKAKAAADAGWESGNGQVTHTIMDEFQAHRDANHKTIVFFHADWCGHCKEFKPKYVSASETLKADGVDVSLVAIDCDTNGDFCHKQGAESFPTIKYYSNNTDKKSKIKFEAAREEDVFVRWAKAMVNGEEFDSSNSAEPESWETNGEVVHLNDKSFAEFHASTPKSLVMFYAPWCGHCKKLKPAWAEASEQLAGKYAIVAVDCTANEMTCKRFDVSGYPTLVYFEEAGGDHKEYNGGRDTAAIVAWANSQIGEDADSDKDGDHQEL